MKYIYCIIDTLKIFKNLIINKPILTVFNVTRLCNERCPMCNIWKTCSENMGLDVVSEYAKKLHNFGIKYVFLQGGEPTLRNDLVEIIDIFIKNRIKPTVISNGILLNFPLALEIAKRNCNLSISLDTLDKQRFIKIRGVDKLNTVVNNIEHNAKIIDRKGNWAITTTVTHLSTLDDIKCIEKFAQKNRYMYAIRPYIYTREKAGKKCDELVYRENEAVKIFKYMADKAKKNNYLAWIIYREHIKYLEKNNMPQCDAMRYSFLLNETGMFAPCLEYPDLNFKLEEYADAKKKYAKKIHNCNTNTPCFYNCVRTIGIICRKRWEILTNLHKIILQMVKYGNFF